MLGKVRIILARTAIALTIGLGFVLVPGLVQAEDCALAPGASVVFGSDTCAVDPSEFAVLPDTTQPVDSVDNSLIQPDPAQADDPTQDGQWDWPGPTGDDGGDPN